MRHLKKLKAGETASGHNALYTVHKAGSTLAMYMDHTSVLISDTVEPLNSGCIGTDLFVHYREVVLFGGKNAIYVGSSWCIRQRCPIFRVSFIRGSTV